MFVEAGVQVKVEESLLEVNVGASRSDVELRRIVRFPEIVVLVVALEPALALPEGLFPMV